MADEKRKSRRTARRERTDGPQLVFGLVGALGTDLAGLTAELLDTLIDFRYEPVVLHLSEFLRLFPPWSDVPARPLDDRIEALQNAGNELRSKTGSPSALAALAVGGIQNHRVERGNDVKEPVPGTAYILRSLKHPAEEELLRRIYGPSFFLIAAYSPLEERRRHLAHAIAGTRHGMRAEAALPRADVLIQRDDHELDRTDGQLVRDTFPLADVFVPVHRPEEASKQVRRFLDLVFGHPFETPTPDEFAMFQARAAALRSVDLSRQVGAVVSTARGDVVAIGTNEVPKATGGQYWAGDVPDGRDYRRGRNESLAIRRAMLAEVLLKLAEEGSLRKDVAERVQDNVDRDVSRLMPSLKAIMSVGEFGRTVHAEMAALMDAARRGVSVADCTLFSTTFPCHNCTKHIVAAGISRVVYVEPFPKSRAAELHDDSIVVDAAGKVEGKVNFEPFVGIAPRRYLELFTMPKREVAGSAVRYTRPAASPRVRITREYVEAEDVAVLDLSRRLDESGLKREGSDRKQPKKKRS